MSFSSFIQLQTTFTSQAPNLRLKRSNHPQTVHCEPPPVTRIVPALIPPLPSRLGSRRHSSSSSWHHPPRAPAPWTPAPWTPASPPPRSAPRRRRGAWTRAPRGWCPPRGSAWAPMARSSVALPAGSAGQEVRHSITPRNSLFGATGHRVRWALKFGIIEE